MKEMSLLAQQRYERMGFDGAIKRSVLHGDTVVGFFRVPGEGLVEVIVGETSWPFHRYRVVTEGMTWYGPEYPSEKDIESPLVSAETFSVYTRRKWSMSRGNFLNVRTAAYDHRDYKGRLAFHTAPFGDYWVAVEKYYPETVDA